MNKPHRFFDLVFAVTALIVGFLSGYQISHLSGYEYTRSGNTNEEHTSGKFFNDVKVLCLVMTFPENHQRKALPVAETWGKLCSRIFFVSNTTDRELPILAVNMSESRSDLWFKVRTAFEWIYKNMLNDYDWFLKADDDTYFHMDNLRASLRDYSPKHALSIGHQFRMAESQDTYHSGGAGYILSREAVRKLVGEGFTMNGSCNEENAYEDVFMGRCLRSLGVKLIDGADENGAYRFQPIPVWDMVSNSSPEWLADKSITTLKEDFNCCSPYFISMHYVEQEQQYLLEYMVHRLRPYGVHFH